MTPERSEILNQFPETTITVVRAIATREMAEAEITGRITQEITGEQPESSRSLEDHMGKTVLQMIMLADESIPQSVRDSGVSRESGGRRIVRELRENGLDVDDESAEQFQALVDAGPNDSGTLDDFLDEIFAGQLKAARGLAEREGVSVADVYADDKLFYQANRNNLSSPEEDAAKRIEIMKAVSVQQANILKLAFLDLISSTPQDDISQEYMNDLAFSFQLDTEVQNQLSENAEITKEVIRQTSIYWLALTWGQDVIEKLPAEQQEALRPTRTLAPTVAEVVG